MMALLHKEEKNEPQNVKEKWGSFDSYILALCVENQSIGNKCCILKLRFMLKSRAIDQLQSFDEKEFSLLYMYTTV